MIHVKGTSEWQLQMYQNTSIQTSHFSDKKTIKNTGNCGKKIFGLRYFVHYISYFLSLLV